jgi:hypothetical protein
MTPRTAFVGGINCFSGTTADYNQVIVMPKPRGRYIRKLTDAQVLDIRIQMATGLRHKTLARRYQVSLSTIADISSYRNAYSGNPEQQ